MAAEMPKVRVFLVGDTGVGKTSCLISYTTQSFPFDYVPAVYDNYILNVMHNGVAVCVSLTDTNADDDYTLLRTKVTYPALKPDVFLIMFDIMNRESLKHAETIWLKEIQQYNEQSNRNVPYLLIATKLDLKEKAQIDDIQKELGKQRCSALLSGYCRGFVDNADLITICFNFYFEESPITTQEGMRMKKQIGAAKYVEHSALTQEGLQNVFVEALEVGFKAKYGSRKSCSIL